MHLSPVIGSEVLQVGQVYRSKCPVWRMVYEAPY